MTYCRPLRIEQLEQRALLTPRRSSITSSTTRARGRLRGIRRRLHLLGFTPRKSRRPMDQLDQPGGLAGTGSGQTIAIIDAYNDPNILSDAAAFSTQFGLQQFNVSGGPTLTVLNQSGGTSLPGTDPDGHAERHWEVEESLDVEWAHSIAPQANIILFEAASASTSNLMAAVKTAADYSGVSVVSMSWGGSESPARPPTTRTSRRPAGTRTSPFWPPRATAVRRASIRPIRPTSSPSAAPP